MKEIELLILEIENKVINLHKNCNIANFEASISGNSEEYKKASEFEFELSKFYSDKNIYAKLKKFAQMEIDDPIIKRQVDLFFNDFAKNQFDEDLHKKIIDCSTHIEEKFSTFRAEANGRNLTDNEIDDILKYSTDNEELKITWEASKSIGKEVKDKVIELVKLRNQAARILGYDNYHQMSLKLNEQTTEDLDKLFDELDFLTRDNFTELKSEIDIYISGRLKIPTKDLMPWHYQDKFFQQGPRIYEVDYDKYYKDVDLVDKTIKYFESIGLQIEDIINKSDLYEKDKKYQHAYCTDIDREGDIRIVCNLKTNHRWMSTMLHETGHAVYDKYISPQLPWQLRTHAHIFTTESIAMLFGRFASNPYWMNQMLNIGLENARKIEKLSHNALRLEQLVFSRWTQVMYRFEKELYINPDQDLNSLWWEIVEKYQLLKKPEGRNEPDWAAKIHMALYPAYYHNYMLGELLASQLYHYISNKVLRSNNPEFECFADKNDAGEYLKNLFFNYGALYNWKELILKATGEPLNPKYYSLQFVV